MPTMNYGELQNLVNTYQSKNRNGLNYALVEIRELENLVAELQQLEISNRVDGIRIYLVEVANPTPQNSQNRVLTKLAGKTAMIAVPTFNCASDANGDKLADDFYDIPSNTITAYNFGWSDSIGMCPPKCGIAPIP